ncbi:MAG: ATP-binding protein [bacterium]
MPQAPAKSDSIDGITREEFSNKLYKMLEISNLVGSLMELDDILHQIANLATDVMLTPTCSIYLFGPHRENLTLRAAAGDSASLVGKRKLPLGRGLPGIAAQTNSLIVVPNAAADPRHAEVFGSGKEQEHAYICSPLRIQESVIGVMTARKYGGKTFSAEDCTLFETISKQVAIVIEKSKMYYDKLEADRLAAISISLSEVAHYIKNLLQGMKGGSYFVDMGLKKEDLDMSRKGWQVLSNGIKKITSLVENMLNYSREMPLNLEAHNINAIIFEILHQIDDTAVERGVALLPETQRSIPNIPLDYDRMYDALLNLISNAIDAIPLDKKDGLVLIKTRLSDDQRYIFVDIIDNGMGIDHETQGKIFNLFFSTKGGKGTGIGLSVTRKVIEKHGGRIDVESEEGKGTTFTLRMPVYPNETA